MSNFFLTFHFGLLLLPRRLADGHSLIKLYHYLSLQHLLCALHLLSILKDRTPIRPKFHKNFSITNLLARVDGQPVSFDNFFINKHICQCKSATGFFGNFDCPNGQWSLKANHALSFSLTLNSIDFRDYEELLRLLSNTLLAAIRIKKKLARRARDRREEFLRKFWETIAYNEKEFRW